MTESDDSTDEARNESGTEALNRARRHTRAALAEALAAIQALLDAASLTLSGEPAASHHLLSPIATFLEVLSERFDRNDESEATALLQSIAAALDQEIARWEARAASDPDARAVLRAFLGLRELLWEFGIRRDGAQSDGEAEPERTTRKTGRAAPKRSEKRRVRRIPIEGS